MCVYICVFCVYFLHTVYVLYYYRNTVGVDLVGLKRNPYRTLFSFSALKLLLRSFDS